MPLTPHAHPWRHLQDWLPDWDVCWCRMDGDLGRTDRAERIIHMDPRQSQGQRRATLAHELAHIVAGDDCGCNARDEARIEQYVARTLIPLDRLIHALQWARNSPEAADELWVDLAAFQTRMAHLHPSELAAIKRARLEREEPA
jgi:hypothetical protein